MKNRLMIRKFNNYIITVLLIISLVFLAHTIANAQRPRRPAMAVAWNKNGYWIFIKRPTLNEAISDAIRLCNQNAGNCLLGLNADEYAPEMCIGIAISKQGDLFSASGHYARSVADNALGYCLTRGRGECNIGHIGCNY